MEIEDLSVAKQLQKQSIMSTLMTNVFKAIHKFCGDAYVFTDPDHIATSLLVCASDVQREAVRDGFDKSGGYRAIDNTLTQLVTDHVERLKHRIAAHVTGSRVGSATGAVAGGARAAAAGSTGGVAAGASRISAVAANGGGASGAAASANRDTPAGTGSAATSRPSLFAHVPPRVLPVDPAMEHYLSVIFDGVDTPTNPKA